MNDGLKFWQWANLPLECYLGVQAVAEKERTELLQRVKTLILGGYSIANMSLQASPLVLKLVLTIGKATRCFL